MMFQQHCDSNKLALVSLCFVVTVIHFHMGSYQIFPQIQRLRLSREMFNGVVVLLHNNVCPKVQLMFGNIAFGR